MLTAFLATLGALNVLMALYQLREARGYSREARRYADKTREIEDAAHAADARRAYVSAQPNVTAQPPAGGTASHG